MQGLLDFFFSGTALDIAMIVVFIALIWFVWVLRYNRE